ncbi:MAG: hypothetical protein QM710_13835 [Flavobacterium sp.]
MKLFSKIFGNKNKPSDSFVEIKSDFDLELNLENEGIKPGRVGCICETPPLSYLNYIECYIGVDKTKGRFADVDINMCIHCRRKWIRYLVEFESFTKSGRWYSGIVNDDDIKNITPENSIEYIESLDWYLFGGSYFSSSGMIGKGKAIVDR